VNSCRWIAGFVLVVVIGCGGGGSKSGSSAGPTANDAANDVSRMLKDFAEATKRAPTSLADMGADYDATHPLGYGAVKSGDYVVVWKAPVSASGSGNVLAYQKDAPSKGGPVVMQDGSVKEMTAAEFTAAPKAK
jgi:hypothetical protein